MKYLYLTVLLLAGLLTWAQELPLNFTVNEKANPWIGKEWDFSYEKMKHAINVDFDGSILKMHYTTGNKYLESQVNKYDYKESTEYGKVKEKLYILEINNKYNLTEYIIIQLKDDYGATIYNISLPFMDKTGIIMSYTKYYGYSN